MHTILVVLGVLLAVMAGMIPSPHSVINAIFTGAVAYLLFEIFALRRRIKKLEEAQAERIKRQAEESTPTLRLDLEQTEKIDPPPQFATPLPLQAKLSAEYATPPVKQRQSSSPTPTRSLFNPAAPLINFFTAGNPVLKVGIVVLFFGVGFLLKYAAQRNLIPIELRLTGVALGGLVLLVTGWLLRRKHTVYGLGLEGAGIGVIYLVVFAAAKLYLLLPMPLALMVMVGLVGLSCTLAVLQESKGLAVSGSIGGFLAPILMSTGAGSHVMLFSYYAVLGGGILGIAWFKAWRELNLVGFVFTFGIAALWGASAYTPAHFATTEPFLILFFLMYCLISVLFAHRQPLQLRGFIDGPLVFGLPIVTSGLQAYLVHDFRYGMALSALAFGFWYVGLARIVWHRMAGAMRMLTESFLALGVVFASLAIPLGLDPHWTAAAWALEGAAMIWVGVRQDRPGARFFGLLLQAGAALAFFDSTYLQANTILFGNRAFLGSALIAIAALFSCFWLDQNRDRARHWETLLPQVLLAWGLIWWYSGGYRDLERHLDGSLLPHGFLLFSCVTTACLAMLARRFSWQRLTSGLLLLLPSMVLTLAAQTLGWGEGSLLTGYGWLVWPLAFALQYGLLALFEKDMPRQALPSWHSLSLWLLILAITVEIAWRVDQIPGLTDAWTLAIWGLIPTVMLCSLEFRGDLLTWPVARFAPTYHGIGTDLPLLVLLLGNLASLAAAGDPAPLPYIPVLNPLELIGLAILLLAAIRTLRAKSTQPARTGWSILVAALLFCWLNGVTGRSIHFFTGVPYAVGALFASPVFQAAVAALWSALALTLTIWGAKKEARPIWLAGAGLLTLVVVKLFLIDLSGTGTIGRIVSFLVVGLLMLIIGFFAPLPPKTQESSP
jgi:uncharacterized membrane protein